MRNLKKKRSRTFLPRPRAKQSLVTDVVQMPTRCRADSQFGEREPLDVADYWLNAVVTALLAACEEGTVETGALPLILSERPADDDSHASFLMAWAQH